MGKADWGQRQELKALEKFGPALDPDWVLTLFLPLNDVQNNHDPLRKQVYMQLSDPGLMFRPGWTRRPADSMPIFWVRSSVLNQLVSHRLAFGLLREGEDRPTSVPVDYRVYSTESSEIWDRAWHETEELLLGMRGASRQMGARFALASASTPQGVLGPEAGVAVLLQSYPAMRGQDWDLDLPNRRLEEISTRNGIPFLSLEPAFREATAAGGELHWQYDGHWNPAGNDLAGRLIAEFLLETVLAEDPEPR